MKRSHPTYGLFWLFVLSGCEDVPAVLGGHTPSGVARDRLIGELSEDERFLLCSDTSRLWNPLVDPLRTCPAIAALLTDDPDTCLEVQSRCALAESYGSRRMDCFTLFEGQEKIRVGVWLACFEAIHATVAPRLRGTCQQPLGAMVGRDPSAALNELLRAGIEAPECTGILGW